MSLYQLKAVKALLVYCCLFLSAPHGKHSALTTPKYATAASAASEYSCYQSDIKDKLPYRVLELCHTHLLKDAVDSCLSFRSLMQSECKLSHFTFELDSLIPFICAVNLSATHTACFSHPHLLNLFDFSNFWLFCKREIKKRLNERMEVSVFDFFI